MARSVFLVICIAFLVSSGAGLKSEASSKPHKHHHKHHHHKSKSGSGPNATTELEFSPDQKSADKKDGYVVRMFEHIQKTLADAWKHKDHLDSLQKTVKAEQHLLSEQENLLQASTDDDTAREARNQVQQTSKMIKQATQLIKNSKDIAVQSTQKALTEAKFLKKQAEKDMANDDATIEKAMAAKEVAQRRMAQADTAIQGANEEAKFFEAKYENVDKADASQNETDQEDEEDAAVPAPPAMQVPSTTLPKMQKEEVKQSGTAKVQTELKSKEASLLTLDVFGKNDKIDLDKVMQLPADQKLALLKEAEHLLNDKSKLEDAGKKQVK